MPPSVSIVMPVYNAAPYLCEALTSLCAQTLQDWELIAIDDGSTDKSQRILYAWQKTDPRIRVIQKAHGGIVGALNKGIEAAQAPYLARMDADDIAAPKRLECQKIFLDAHPDVVAVGTSVLLIDKAGLPIYTYHRPTWHEAIEYELLSGNGGALIHPSMMARTNILQEIGGYREQYDCVEDLDLYYRLLNEGHLANLPEVLLQYRQHFKSTNFSEKKAKQNAAVEYQLVNDFRRTRGHAPMSIAAPWATHTRAEVYHRWAQSALAERFYKTAFKYTLKALINSPLKKQSWSFAKYALVFWLKSRCVQK